MMESINQSIAWFGAHPTATALLFIWILIWKGIALWRAAGLRQKYWFVAILILNTLGLLEIFYIFFVASKYEVEIVIEEKMKS